MSLRGICRLCMGNFEIGFFLRIINFLEKLYVLIAKHCADKCVHTFKRRCRNSTVAEVYLRNSAVYPVAERQGIRIVIAVKLICRVRLDKLIYIRVVIIGVYNIFNSEERVAYRRTTKIFRPMRL